MPAEPSGPELASENRPGPAGPGEAAVLPARPSRPPGFGSPRPSPVDPELAGIPVATFFNDPAPWEAIAVFGAILVANGALLPLPPSVLPLREAELILLALLGVASIFLLFTRFTAWLVVGLGTGLACTALLSVYLPRWLPVGSGDLVWDVGSPRFEALVALVGFGALAAAIGARQFLRIWSEPDRLGESSAEPPAA
jgi:hypothetical protein